MIRYIRESFFAARPFTTLEDFNRQAHLWRDPVAHQRPWPQDDSRTVAQAFAEEQPRLLPLPARPLETDCLVSLDSGKTIYLRFDLNDYSIPPTAVGRALTLLASPSTIRILRDGIEIARHRRSWDRHQIIEEPAHRQALLEEKRRALGASPSSEKLNDLHGRTTVNIVSGESFHIYDKNSSRQPKPAGWLSLRTMEDEINRILSRAERASSVLPTAECAPAKQSAF